MKNAKTIAKAMFNVTTANGSPIIYTTQYNMTVPSPDTSETIARGCGGYTAHEIFQSEGLLDNWLDVGYSITDVSDVYGDESMFTITLANGCVNVQFTFERKRDIVVLGDSIIARVKVCNTYPGEWVVFAWNGYNNRLHGADYFTDSQDDAILESKTMVGTRSARGMR